MQSLLLAALLLADPGHAQNPFQGFNLGGLLSFAAKETSKVIRSHSRGGVRVVNPLDVFSAAIRRNSDQQLTIGTPFGSFNIGGGQKTTSAPTPATTTATTSLPTAAPTTAATNRPCKGGRCRPRPTKGVTSELHSGCGINLRSVGTRIVGGVAADPSAWPWMVALLRSTPGAFCGGVLVSQRHVLTAAHCVQQFRPWEVRVRLGVYDFTNDTGTAGEAIRRIAVHPRYDSSTYRNDAAVLTLARPARPRDIRPICLPKPGRSFEHATATVTGWGTIYSGGPTSSVLRQATIPVWGERECDAAYPQTIDRLFICAGGRRGGHDACQGDSGGPLQYRRPDGTWSVIGIVSWGRKCAQAGYPGVYTRVTHMLPWIRRKTGGRRS